MTYEVACLLHHQRCKDIFRAVHIQDVRITLLHEVSEFIQQVKAPKYALLIVDTRHKDSEKLLRNIISKELSNSTIIITSQFNQETFRKYVKLGYRYIVDIDTFVCLVPTILENLVEFIQNDFQAPREITKRGVTISIECGYIIFHGCKITTSRSALLLLCALLNSNGYCNSTYLQSYLEKAIKTEVSSSYITVTISRLNREIYIATGMKIIKNRYGFGYYLDI